MRTTEVEALTVEARAIAHLKGLKVMMAEIEPSKLTKTFSAMEAPDLVAGHAWRALKLAAGSAVLEKWQRQANRAAVLALIDRAISIAAKRRREHPGFVEQLQSGEAWETANRLWALQHKVDQAVDTAIRAAAILEKEGPLALVNAAGKWTLIRTKTGRAVTRKQQSKSRRVRAP